MTVRHKAELSMLLVAVWTAGACTGQIAGTQGGLDPDEPGQQDPGGNDPGAGGGNGTGGSGTVAAIKGVPECTTSGPSVGFAPLRRMTRAEYDNTVRDLLGDTSRPAKDFTADEPAGGFDANSVAPLDLGLMESYADAAATLAKTAVGSRLGTLLGGCDVKVRACVDSFVNNFGKKAFRRPLAADVKAPLMTLYDSATTSWGADVAIEMVLQAILSSPYFLYHGEKPPQGQDAVRLDGYGLASRLSYFLWQSMPDDELFTAAESGLASDAAVEAQVRRMLADGRARDTLASFHSQWLGLGSAQKLAAKFKDPAAFPQWGPELATAMLDETVAFADHVIRQDDSRLSTLLTASYSFVNDKLAPVYGVAAPSGRTLARVDLDPRQRAGLLTHPSFLTSQAHAAESSWVLRGKFVRERLFCEFPPPPPPTVDAMAANDVSRLENPKCRTCHLLMDPIGLGLENFDALGKWRDNDAAGKPIDGAGEIGDFAGTDAAGTFRGPRELADRLAGSKQVQACVSSEWFSYGVRRAPGDADGCSMRSAFDRFNATGGDLRELIVAVALSDSFRHQRGGSL